MIRHLFHRGPSMREQRDMALAGEKKWMGIAIAARQENEAIRARRSDHSRRSAATKAANKAAEIAAKAAELDAEQARAGLTPEVF